MSNVTVTKCPTCGEGKVAFDGKISEVYHCKKCGKAYCYGAKCGKKYGYLSCPGCYTQSPSLTTTQVEEASSKGCFVATAAFGSYSSPEVLFLSAFRDELLVRNCFGLLFIRIYYVTAPFLASLIIKSELLQLIARSFILAPIICGLKLFFEPEAEQ